MERQKDSRTDRVAVIRLTDSHNITDRQTGRHKKTDKQVHRQKDRQMNGQTDGQTK